MSRKPLGIKVFDPGSEPTVRMLPNDGETYINVNDLMKAYRLLREEHNADGVRERIDGILHNAKTVIWPEEHEE